MFYPFSKSWVAVFLLAATPVFVEANMSKDKDMKKEKCPSHDQGHEMSKCQMMCAYSAPAAIKLGDSSWDVYATASFIYWQAQQENMEIGMISQNDPEAKTGALTFPFDTSYVNNITITQPNFTYRPGFKVGLGMTFDWDGWDGYAEYTWFHGSIGSGVRPLPAETATTPPPNGQYLYPIQGASGGFSLLYFQSADQSWSLKMDFLDVSLARSYYSGMKLSVRPFFGARGAWIRQNLTTLYSGSTTYANISGHQSSAESDYSSSWGVGPRAGFESNWMVGHGLRIIGNGAADVLYTRYHTHSDLQLFYIDAAHAANPITSNSAVAQNIDYLRTHLDLEMGFGWGMYFDNNNWHVDLSATYGFQVFWDQNMFRNFESFAMSAKSFAPNGNLYVHGLTTNLRFDF
jgi:hypothetical protein